MRNALTVDVEDYFHTNAMANVAPRDSWRTMQSRVERNTWKLLELFDRHRVRTTMFFLGSIAEEIPGLVAAAVSAGHEPACHSYSHRPVCRLIPAEFREDTLRAKDAIEAAGCKRVFGYRAPNFSIVQNMDWAYDTLADLGFTYSSSSHPIWHDHFSNPDARRLPHRTKSGLLEIPITTWPLLNKNLPVGGGAYLRILPFGFVNAGLRRVHDAGEKLMVYVHPWEVDDEQPRLPAGLKSRVRQYTGLKRMSRRLEKLMSSFRFTTASEAFAVEHNAYPVPTKLKIRTATA